MGEKANGGMPPPICTISAEGRTRERAVHFQQPRTETGADIAGRIKSILETRRLALYQVSQLCEAAYGRRSPYRLPHNLYYRLRLGTFSPNLYQLFALSRISGYRLEDWLRVLGFDLEGIPRLQVLIPTKRTVLLDSSVGNPDSWVPWFRDRVHSTVIPPIAPLSQLLAVGPPVKQCSLIGMQGQRFLYAKVGSEDALAFPDLLPGSIVRIDSKRHGTVADQIGIGSQRLYLVDHGRGLACCRLIAAGGNRILTVSTHLPYAQIEFELDREAQILGVADLEIRPLGDFEPPRVPKNLANRWKPKRLIPCNIPLSRLLETARIKAGLSLRDASALTGQIATMLRDKLYFMSASSLSAYEASDMLPHHIQKVISLCVVYAIPFHALLNTAGIPAASAGRESIPERFMPSTRSALPDTNIEPQELDKRGFLGELLHRSEEVPVFLRGVIADICGLTSPSLRSFFWIGGIRSPLHPYLANGLLVSINRHRQRPIDSRSRAPWQQLLYVVLKRDGNYVCGPCGLENGDLVMHPDAAHVEFREQFRNRSDAEVVGQATAIARRLL